MVVTCGLFALKEGAEPKAYLATLVGLTLIGSAGLWGRTRPVGPVLSVTACVVCVAALAAGWGFPLSKAATARLLERQNTADAPVRCVTPPRPGGYPEFGDQLFGRTYVCGSKRLGDWDNKGGIRIGQGIGVEVDDTHVVGLYP